jgi:hypothetical protein
MSQLLNTLVPCVKFDNSEAKRYFSECSNACEKMSLSAKLIRKYIEDVHNEADKEGITKN